MFGKRMETDMQILEWLWYILNNKIQWQLSYERDMKMCKAALTVKLELG